MPMISIIYLQKSETTAIVYEDKMHVSGRGKQN